MHEWYCVVMKEVRYSSLNWLSSSTVPVEKYFLASSLTLILLFAWMEPSGAAGIGFWKGLVFWTVQISILIPLLIAVQHSVSHYLTLRTSHSAWIQTAVSGLAASLVFVPIGYFLDFLFAIPNNESPLGIAHGLLGEAAGLVLPVTVTWIALNAPWIFELDFSKRTFGGTDQPLNSDTKLKLTEDTKTTRFLKELKSRASGDLISISSELHYVRVVTTDTEVMFLYNLKDAIEELPIQAGVQIHRSHWVAKGHVREVKRINGVYECALSNGKRLPISRRKYSEVKDLLKQDRLDCGSN